MKAFALDSSYTSMAGVFYPTGHVFALFATAEAVKSAAEALATPDGKENCSYAGPETIMQHIVRTLGNGDQPLPSVGADGDFVRRIADLAGKGCHGLLIDVGKADVGEQITPILESNGAEAAFYYRTLVIEDLITRKPDAGPQSVTVGTHAAAAAPDDRAP